MVQAASSKRKALPLIGRPGVTGVEPAEFRQCEISNGPRAIRRPVHGRIVQDNDLAVLCDLNVHLQDIDAERRRLPEGVQGVFRPETRRPGGQSQERRPG